MELILAFAVVLLLINALVMRRRIARIESRLMPQAKVIESDFTFADTKAYLYGLYKRDVQ